ncbi:MAG: ABC transporter ATP-binding protein [Halobacteria archaeon]
MRAISTRGLTKRYGKVTAVNGVDLEVNEGDVYGFLGPNGAGKSTTIKMILDFVRPTSGSVEVMGVDPQENPVEVKKNLGFLPQEYGLYPRLTGKTHIEFAMESKGVDGDPDVLLERVGLDGEGDRKVGGYSGGMKKRLALAMAISGEPSVLVLDEPTSALDPNGAREVREIVREENERGATVFFSSHILEQVEAVCNRVGILSNGSLVVQDNVDHLRGGESVLEVTVLEPGETVEEVGRIDGVKEVSQEKTEAGFDLNFRLTSSEAKIKVIEKLQTNGCDILDFSTEEKSLEEMFAQYTEQHHGGGE